MYLVEYLNEGSNLVLLYHTICYTQMIVDDMDRYEFGWSFVAFFIISFTLHMALLVWTIASTAYRRWR